MSKNGLPPDVTAIEQWNRDRFLKATYRAEEDEVKAVVRKVIKIRVQRQGAVEAFKGLGYNMSGLTTDYFTEYDKQNEESVWGKLSGQDTVALFITVSPEPASATPDSLLADADKLSSRKGVAWAIWSIEQSGTIEKENVGYHPHLHMLIFLDKSVQQGERSKMRSTVERRFKKYKTKSEAYLDIKAVSEPKLKDKIAYVEGNKTDKSKHAQVEADKQWRNDNGYDHVYKTQW